MIKIFGYVRESTMQQAIFGYNIEEQKRVIEDYCKYHYKDYELDVFVEKGKSATTLNRPELKNLLEKVKKAKADKVVFHSLDRLTRDVKDLYTLIEFFNKSNIELVSVVESLDLSTAIGRSHVFNSGVYAQLESERTSERTIRALKQGVLEGKYPFAGSPLGYDKVDKRLQPSEDKNQIEIVNFLFNSVADNKYSYRELEDILKKKFNFLMDWETIPDLISNTIYIGIKRYREVVNESYCKPLISLDLFERANRNVNVRKRRGNKRNTYVFKDLVYCSECNKRLVQRSATGRGGKKYVYYKCECCGAWIPQNSIIDKCDSSLYEVCQKFQLDEKNYYTMNEELVVLRNKQKQLVKKHKEHKINSDDFFDIYESYQEEIELLEKQLSDLNVKTISFKNYSPLNQKEIIGKYVDSVFISKKGTRKNDFKAIVNINQRYV